MNLTLDQADIDAYLSPLQEHDIVGCPRISCSCLLANVLRRKYPAYEWYVGRFMAEGLLILSEESLNGPLPINADIALSEEMTTLIDLFDQMLVYMATGYKPVTKGRWIEFWNRLGGMGL